MEIGNKKVIYVICLCILLIAGSAFGVYKYTVSHEILLIQKEVIVNSQDSVVNKKSKVGNANYFNEKDGKYYVDKKFKKEANDNTAYILSLFSSDKSVSLPEGNFLCKTNIILNGTELSVTGVKGKTKIVFDSNTFSSIDVGTLKDGIIRNKNQAGQYIDESSQSINISNITFEYKRFSTKSPITIMLLKNIKAANIKNCSFITDLPNGIPVTNLDLYNGCKNVTVSDCSFINKTKAGSGGCIWVRNLTTQMKDIEGNTTENVNIDKCTFEKDSKDEVIAVYSVVGNVKNVIISNCNINDYSDKQQIVMSVYSSEDKFYGTVDNVIISNNNIYSQNYNAFIIFIENKVKPTSNVIISTNKIVSDSKSSNTKSVIYNSSGDKDFNIIVNNNDITANNTNYFVAIANVTVAEKNKIAGAFDIGIAGGKIMDNTITGARNGIVNPVVALKNKLSQINYGIRVDKGDSYLYSNIITLDRSSAICGIEVKSQNYVTCTKNSIQTFNSNQFGFITKNVNTVLTENEVLGEGKNSISK